MVQSGLIGLFSSYDIFGKSIPGAVFFLGFISALPSESNAYSALINTTGLPAGNFVVLLLLALGAGLVFGEAVHTLANISEGFVAWTGRRIIEISEFIRNNLPELHYYIVSDVTDYASASPFEERIYLTIDGTKQWFRSRYYDMNSAVKGHRRLFAERCVTNYGDKSGPRKNRDAKNTFKEFEKRFNNIFEDGLPKTNKEELIEIYPLITAEVTKSGAAEFRRFQSIYSFCRSMWVTLFTFVVVHSLILAGNEYSQLAVLDYTSVFRANLFTESPYLIPASLFLSGFLFLIASGTYKEHYVEYLVAEFAIHVEDNEQQS